jgi:hypothetical protein
MGTSEQASIFDEVRPTIFVTEISDRWGGVSHADVGSGQVGSVGLVLLYGSVTFVKNRRAVRACD